MLHSDAEQAPDGAVLLTLTGRGPPPGSAPATYDDVLASLDGQGISLIDVAAHNAASARCESP